MSDHKDTIKMTLEGMRDNAASTAVKGEKISAEYLLELLAMLAANEATMSHEPGDVHHYKMDGYRDVSNRIRAHCFRAKYDKALG